MALDVHEEGHVKLKKMVMGASALGIAVGMMAVLEVGPAFAAGKVTATGKVTCTSVKGTISFSPALTSAGGASSDSAKVSVTLSGCSGGSVTPTKGTVKSTITTNTNACTGLASPNPTQTETLSFKWSPSTINSSSTTFGPFTAITSPNVGFSLKNGVTTGSYAGSSATGTVLTSTSTSALSAACASKSGLKKLTLSSGSVSLG